MSDELSFISPDILYVIDVIKELVRVNGHQDATCVGLTGHKYNHIKMRI